MAIQKKNSKRKKKSLIKVASLENKIISLHKYLMNDMTVDVDAENEYESLKEKYFEKHGHENWRKKL